MKKILFFIITIVSIGIANAQISFIPSIVSISGDCSSLSAKVWVGMVESAYNQNTGRTFTNCEECNQSRQFFLDMSDTRYGCTIRVSATPCTPCGGAGGATGEAFGEADVLGLSQGTSYFSSNPANEVQDWAEDNEELLRILGGEKPVKHEFVSDNGYVFSAHMPGTISKFILDDNPEIYGARDGVHVPDDFFDRPFHLDTGKDYNREYFENIKTELQPVQFAKDLKTTNVITDDVAWDDFGDILKFAISLPLYAQAATLFVADMAVNLVIEDTKMWLKLHRGEYVKMDEVTSTIAYNTLNKSVEDALFIVTSKGFMKASPQSQLPKPVYSGSLSFITTFVSINSRHINAE